jgi:hypothetical protein
MKGGCMKKRGILVIFLVTALSLTGCASLKEKFIPKKKEEETTMRYQVVRTYDVHPSLELYTKRYIFWKNWQRELLEVLRDDNQKKVRVAAEQAVSNLYDMKRMLVDEKGDELQLVIDDMVKVEDTIRAQKVTQGNRTRLRKQIEQVGRQVKRNFSYTKVGDYIRDDFRSEEYSSE